jgi:hypothetical protein
MIALPSRACCANTGSDEDEYDDFDEYDEYEDYGDYDEYDEREFDSYAGIGVDH